MAESKDDITISYQFTIKEAKDQGLVFGSPEFKIDGITNPSSIDGISFQDIFAAILSDSTLNTIMTNRSDTAEGFAIIESAQTTSNLEERTNITKKMNEQTIKDKENIIKNTFASNLNRAKTEPIFAAILDDNLPKISDEVFEERLTQLIARYGSLTKLILLDDLFKMGKFEGKFGIFEKFDMSIFKGKDIKISLAAFLFYVAKTFMRIPIVLLTASTTENELKNYENAVINDNEKTKYNNCIEIYKQLRTHIYPNEINSVKNKSLITGITASSSGNSSNIYKSFLKSEVEISIDMLCFLLIYLLTTSTDKNYDYYIIAFCERMIYIIDYWTNKDSVSNTNETNQKVTRLGQLHFTSIKVNVDNDIDESTSEKSRYFSAILQRIHNTNDNLITFVKIRKGQVTIDKSKTNTTVNDNKTMNIRYSGIADPDPKKINKQTGKITQDNKILELRYDDNVKPFYNDCKIVDNNGDPTVIYARYDSKCDSKDNDNEYKPDIEESERASSVEYKHDFNLGPFTYIYDENMKNKDIAESAIFKKKILQKLTESKGIPVCIIGYGASGSGKTSVLVQLSASNKAAEPGILMYVSDALGEKGYINCAVRVIEFGKIGNETPGSANENAFIGSYKYNNNKNWKLIGDTFSMDFETISGMKTEKECTRGSMFKDLLRFLEHARVVRRTPNNPVSSRTHIIISLTYSNGTDTKKLFICDLAGVENAFECDSISNDISDKNSADKFNTIITKNPPPCESNIASSVTTRQASTESSASPERQPPQISSAGPSSTGPSSPGPSSSGPASSGPSSSGPASSGPASSGPASSGPAAGTSASMPVDVFGTSTIYNATVNENATNSFDAYKRNVYPTIMNAKNEFNGIIENNENNFGLKDTINNIGSFVLNNRKYELGNYFNTIKKYINTGSTERKVKFKKLIDFITDLNALSVDENVTVTEKGLANGKCYNYSIKQMTTIPSDYFKVIEGNNTIYEYTKDNKKEYYQIIRSNNTTSIKEVTISDIYVLNVNGIKYNTLFKLCDEFTKEVKNKYSKFKKNIIQILNLRNYDEFDIENKFPQKNIANLPFINYIEKYLPIITSEHKYPPYEVITISIDGKSTTYKSYLHAFVDLGFITKDDPLTMKIASELPDNIIKEPPEGFINYYKKNPPAKVGSDGVKSTGKILYELIENEISEANISLNLNLNSELNKISNTKIPNENFYLLKNSDFNSTVKFSSTLPPTISDFKPNSRVFYNGINYDDKESLNPVLQSVNKYDVKISNEKITEVFKEKQIIKSFIDNYKSFLNDLLTSITPNPSNIYSLSLYLKTKFLNEFENKYNIFQRQVLLEQIVFTYDLVNDSLDSNYNTTTQGGNMQTGGGSEGFKKECEDRTLEGRYINKFLEEMRTGIAKYVANVTKKKGMPSFFSKCLPLQCNPAFKDCLGINNYNPVIPDKLDDENYGELVNTVIKYVKETETVSNTVTVIDPPPSNSTIANNIVFCVFCVLNLSEPPLVRDPPPVPYVDLTQIQQLYKILENLKIESFRDPVPILEDIKQEMLRITESDQFKAQYNSETDENLYINTVAYKLANTIKFEPDKLDSIIGYVKDFITFISNVNAATPIGTVLFTDSVAKNFVEVNTCNAYQQVKYGYLSEAAKEAVNSNLDNKGGSSNYEYHMNDDAIAEPKPTKSSGGVKNGNTRKIIYNQNNHTGNFRITKRK